MSCEPVLPTPLRHKIAGWNLPAPIELALLEEVYRHLQNDPVGAGTVVRAFEFSTAYENTEYGFFAHYALRAGDGGHIVVLDMDIEPVTRCSCELDEPK
jgi:hypothetical protein